MERGIRKTFSFVKHAIVSKSFGKMTLKPCKTSSPRMTEQIQILKRRLDTFLDI